MNIFPQIQGVCDSDNSYISLSLIAHGSCRYIVSFCFYFPIFFTDFPCSLVWRWNPSLWSLLLHIWFMCVCAVVSIFHPIRIGLHVKKAHTDSIAMKIAYMYCITPKRFYSQFSLSLSQSLLFTLNIYPFLKLAKLPLTPNWKPLSFGTLSTPLNIRQAFVQLTIAQCFEGESRIIRFELWIILKCNIYNNCKTISNIKLPQKNFVFNYCCFIIKYNASF